MSDQAPATRDVPGPPQLTMQGLVRRPREHSPPCQGLLACAWVHPPAASRGKPAPAPSLQQGFSWGCCAEGEGDTPAQPSAPSLSVLPQTTALPNRGTTGETAHTRLVPQACRKQSEATTREQLVVEPRWSCCGDRLPGLPMPTASRLDGTGRETRLPREHTFTMHK